MQWNRKNFGHLRCIIHTCFGMKLVANFITSQNNTGICFPWLPSPLRGWERLECTGTNPRYLTPDPIAALRVNAGQEEWWERLSTVRFPALVWKKCRSTWVSKHQETLIFLRVGLMSRIVWVNKMICVLKGDTIKQSGCKTTFIILILDDNDLQQCGGQSRLPKVVPTIQQFQT